MATVFLSYDHDDVERAAPIAAALEKAGHSVWWDRHIHGGAQYNDEIEAAVESADAVVVLWSKRSVRSAWVRDEAAEGRDQGKLVPLLLDAVKPPMGFRQFQTIDLTASRRGPTDHQVKQMLHSIDAVGGAKRSPSSPAPVIPLRQSSRIGRPAIVVAVVAALVAAGAVAGWSWYSTPSLPVVTVAAANSSPGSQALSRDLFVKLGSLAQLGQGKWQLADPDAAPSEPELVFRVSESRSAAGLQANVVLLDGRADSVLWSRDFSLAAGAEADLRQQVSSVAGIALGCNLEARAAGGLPVDLFKLFLKACADGGESYTEVMRTIVTRHREFRPAWAGLLMAESGLVTDAIGNGEDPAPAQKRLAEDIQRARLIDSQLPEIKLAEIVLLHPHDYAGVFERLAEAKARAVRRGSSWFSEPTVWFWESIRLQYVGRMTEAINAAKRAAEMDPLSPDATTQVIMTLAYGGRIELAKEELLKAERRWADTEALRDAQFRFHYRFGDAKIAQTISGDYKSAYYRARLDPTPENVNAALAEIDEDSSGLQAIQALGEFHRTDQIFGWLNRIPPDKLATASYVLFRPQLAEAHRDPRFMALAKRIGLVTYWQKSGKWPDFCFEPKFPYDCKKEASKLN